MFKTLSLSLPAVLLASLSAHAAWDGAFLTKKVASGHVKPANKGFVQCKIFADKIVITRDVAGIETVETRQLQANVEQLAEEITAATEGPFEEIPLGGANFVSYSAMRKKSDGQMATVILRDRASNEKMYLNQSESAEILRRVLDLHCQ
jgi:hypothetical protein